MYVSKSFYLLLLSIISFNTTQGSESLESSQLKTDCWYYSYIKPLDYAEQIEFYNGILSMIRYCQYTIWYENLFALYEKSIEKLRISNIKNREGIFDDLLQITCKCKDLHSYLIMHSIKSDDFLEKCQNYPAYQAAMDTLFNNLLSELSLYYDNNLADDLHQTRINIYGFMRDIIRLEDIALGNYVAVVDYDECVLPIFNKLRTELGRTIRNFQSTNLEFKKILKDRLSLYASTIVTNINL